MSALDKQEGGGHYKDKAIQPVQYIHANGLGFCEGNVVKYITRWREKGGKADLLKVIHYVELLMELEGIADKPTGTPRATEPAAKLADDPWYGAPDWAKYKAQDADGDWYWYENRPAKSEDDGEWTTLAVYHFAHDGTPNPNWRDTLINR